MQRYSVQFRNTILQKMIGPEKRTAADLSALRGIRGFCCHNLWVEIERPKQVWSIDITYIRMEHRFVYLTAGIDYYSCTLLP